VLLNYRLQVMEEGVGHPAFSPRLSLILPTGDEGDDHTGLQMNLPFSKQRGDFYLHGNAGLTWVRGVPLGSSEKTDLTSPFLAGSLIWRARPMLNVLLESVAQFDETPDDTPAASPRTLRARAVTFSPGLRTGWNIGDAQVIIGAAVPVTWSGGTSTTALLTYFSYELPFTRAR
jgi:hypothetical protein